MPELSSEAEALVVAGRAALRPSLSDRERIAALLRARLGDAALPQRVLQLAAAAQFPLWGKLLALATAAGIAGAVAVLMWEQPAHLAQPAAFRAASLAAPVVSAGADPSAAPAPALGNAPVAAESALEPRRAAPRRAQDNLAREVAILSRATSDLNAGRAAHALEILEEHRRTFPNGLLSEERRAARAQALCALGRRGEAESELRSLARTAPQSPNTARAREVCGRAR